MIRDLTLNELYVLESLAAAWNSYLELPILHNDDIPDFRNAIHNAQRIILSRPHLPVQGK